MAGAEAVVDPRREANERLGAGYDARVLEPSPPTVRVGPWFADDPVASEPRGAGRGVGPVSTAEVTWDALAHDDDALAEWCADRWLGAWRPLEPVADAPTLAGTRDALHVVAEHVLAPARHASNGKIGLRFTRGGFGTPFFGADEQVRVQDGSLVVVRHGAATVLPLTTPRAASRATGGPLGAAPNVYAPVTPLDPDAPLAIDPDAAACLASWFGFACSVLEELRAGMPEAGDSRVQLWPEHFDLSVDLGDETRGTRGTFGASPGDAEHPLPYLYVTHWADVGTDPFWNDASFGGAGLGYEELLAAADQRGAALAFLRRGRAALGA